MDKNLSLQDSIFLAAGFVLLMWSVKLVESLLGENLYYLGVNPQALSGLFGVLVAPLIHGSVQHVLGNTLPVLLLGSMLIYGYPKSRWWVLIIVWLASGLGVWFFARSSFHIGASGLTHGVFFFLVIAGILRHDSRSSALLMVAFFMYGATLIAFGKRGLCCQPAIVGVQPLGQWKPAAHHPAANSRHVYRPVEVRRWPYG